MKIQHRYLAHSCAWGGDGLTSASWSIGRERSLNPRGNRYLSYMGWLVLPFSYFRANVSPRSVSFRWWIRT